MVFAVLLGLLFAALTCGAIAVAITFAVKSFCLNEPEQNYRETDDAFKTRYNKALAKDKKFKIIKWVGAALVLPFFILLLLIPGSFHTVDTGEVAVVKHLGDAKEVRTAGTYFDFWMTKSYDKYDIKVQTLDITDSAYSRDAQTMDIQMTVQYSIKSSREEVLGIAVEYGSLDALSNRIRSVAIEKTKGILSQHKAMNDETSQTGIIENRELVSKEVTDTVKEALAGYYVNVTTVALTNIDFTDAFEKTVEDKMIAEQQKLQAQYEAEKRKIEADAAAEVARIEAEAQVKVAKATAEAKIAAAQGDAEAQKTIAAAEAYATQKKLAELARTLGHTVEEDDKGTFKITWKADAGSNPEKVLLDYLQYLEYLATWNGELPDVITDANGIIISPKP